MGENLLKLVGTFVFGNIAGREAFLYIRRKENDDIEPFKLTVPGGHIEEGESERGAALRELSEETGISGDARLGNRIISLDFLGSFIGEVETKEHKKIKAEIYTFFAIVSAEKISLEEGTTPVFITKEEFEKMYLSSLARGEHVTLKDFTDADKEAIRIYGDIVLWRINNVKTTVKV